MNSDSTDESWPGFDVERYLPKSFSAEEEAQAHAAGYANAREKRKADTEYEHWVHFQESSHRRAKAKTRYGLETVGVPPEDLGAVAKAPGELPRVPEYTLPEPVVPKDPVMKEAAKQGIRQRLVRHLTRHPELYRQWQHEKEWIPDGEDQRAAQHELERIKERMHAFGDDAESVADAIRKGDITEEDDYDITIPPKDPELRRVYDEYDKDLKRWKDRHEE